MYDVQSVRILKMNGGSIQAREEGVEVSPKKPRETSRGAHDKKN
jgi:hypothetical protein